MPQVLGLRRSFPRLVETLQQVPDHIFVEVACRFGEDAVDVGDDSRVRALLAAPDCRQLLHRQTLFAHEKVHDLAQLLDICGKVQAAAQTALQNLLGVFGVVC